MARTLGYTHPITGVNVSVFRVDLRVASVLVLAAALAGCSSGEQGAGRDTTVSAAALAPAMAAITSDNILQHVNRLASDGFEGRGPGTAGEDSSVAYITEQFKALGLAPGNPDGSYIQPVSMIGYTSHPEASIVAGGKTMRLRFPGDYVATFASTTPTWCSSGTASSRRSTGGTITRGSTSRARRS